jgi:hypothetical protein
VDVDFRGDNKESEAAGVFYSIPGGVLKVAYPVFLSGEKIPPVGKVAEVNRRRELARLVTDSADFRRNIANRVWGAIFGSGLVEFEQAARGNTITHPDPLVVLGDQFAAHGYDVRKLMLWCTLSEPFRLQARPSTVARVDQRGEVPLFHQFDEGLLAKPRPPREMLAAALRSLNQTQLNATTTAKVEALPDKLGAKGKSKSATGAAAKPAPIFQSGGSAAEPMVNLVLANDKLSDKQKAEHLFHMALHRPPRGSEQSALNEILKKSGDNVQRGLRAIWAAVSSSQR